MASRSEYQKQYNLKNKEKISEQKKEKYKEKNDKLEKLKKELEKTKEENSWFDPNRNYFLNKLPHDECEKFNEEKRKRFNLQYDIDHLKERTKGDSKRYLKKREESYYEFRREEDVKFRIILWRVFRNDIFKKLGREPDFTDMMVNSVCFPDELDENSEDYRSDLLYLLEDKYKYSDDFKYSAVIPENYSEDESDSDSDGNHALHTFFD